MKAGALYAWIMIMMTAGALCLLSSCSTAPSLVQTRNEEQRASIRTVAEQALLELYRAKPGTQNAVENSAGYAVFSDFGFTAVYMEDARAMGVAVNNGTKQETFMKMVQLHPGPGTPDSHKFRMVLVFETGEALRAFTKSAWILGPEVMAAAIPDNKAGPFGGAMLLQPGMHVYQLDEHGALKAFSIRDVMFYRDRELQ